jgi:hypothetical protein
MNLFTQMARWRVYWREVSDPAEVERCLARLEWLQEFAFHCGPAITPEHFRALEHQIKMGERRRAELKGDAFEEVALKGAER